MALDIGKLALEIEIPMEIMTPEPTPTRCDCRFHDDGTTTVCGVHQPPPLMYYTDAD